MAPLVRTGGSRHTGLAALPYRNIHAIAHNDVVYDTRFKKMDPSRPMKQCLILEMGDAVHKFQNNRRLHHPYLLLLKITESL